MPDWMNIFKYWSCSRGVLLRVGTWVEVPWALSAQRPLEVLSRPCWQLRQWKSTGSSYGTQTNPYQCQQSTDRNPSTAYSLAKECADFSAAVPAQTRALQSSEKCTSHSTDEQRVSLCSSAICTYLAGCIPFANETHCKYIHSQRCNKQWNWYQLQTFGSKGFAEFTPGVGKRLALCVPQYCWGQPKDVSLHLCWFHF